MKPEESSSDSSLLSAANTSYSETFTSLPSASELPQQGGKAKSVPSLQELEGKPPTRLRSGSISLMKGVIKSLKVPAAVDIGGSFTKMVYFRPPNPPPLPAFVQKESTAPRLPLHPDPSLHVSSPHLGGVLCFLKFPSKEMLPFVSWILDNQIPKQYGPGVPPIVYATGGGAYKFQEFIEKQSSMQLCQLDEMLCLILGLNFLLTHTDNEIFTYSFVTQEKAFVSVKEADRFPYLLVNCGSGVSILKVTGPESFERVSGSPLGGGTFWGLCRLLTNYTSFKEMQKDIHYTADPSEFSNAQEDPLLRGRGSSENNIDLLVGDIYGGDYPKFNLKAGVVASCFGKISVQRDLPESVCEKTNQFPSDSMAKSLLFMVASNIAQIAYLNAKLHGVKRVIFHGGFIEQSPLVWGRLSFAINYWSQGEMQAMFLQHDGYLGCLGALIWQFHTNSPPAQPLHDQKQKSSI